MITRFTKQLKLCVGAILLFAGLKSFGQAGEVDTSFYYGMGTSYKVGTIAPLPDSSLVIGGFFEFSNYDHSVHYPVGNITKLLPNGDNDPSFNVGTGADNTVNVVLRQPDGKFLVGGDFIQFNGALVYRIARLMPDGTFDASFVSGTGFQGSGGSIYDIRLQADGKILIGGSFSNYNGVPAGNLIRLFPDGTVDNAFNTGSGTDSAVYSIDVQPDGKIILGGIFKSYDGDPSAIGVTRINSDGSRDATFQVGTGPRYATSQRGNVTCAYHQPDGRIIIGGYFTLYPDQHKAINNHDDTVNNICRLLANGTIDTTFLTWQTLGGGSDTFKYGRSTTYGGANTPLSGLNGGVNEIAIQPDGSIVVTGGFTKYHNNSVMCNNLIRLDSNGLKDAGFLMGTALNAFGSAIAILPSGEMFVGGRFNTMDSFSRLRCVKLYANGKVDQRFYHDSRLNSQVLAIGQQKNGQLIVGGGFTKYDDLSTNRICRLTLSGLKDATFNANAISANSTVRAICVLPDDKILIGGDFTTYNGTAVGRIARLNANGSLDATFTPGTGAAGTIYDIAYDGVTGKIYIGGAFTTFSGRASKYLARLNYDGTLDTTFNIGTGFNSTIQKVTVQPNGYILCGGSFTTYNGFTHNRIIRLDGNAVFDPNFLMGTGCVSTVYAITVLSNGKIMIGGLFTTYNGSAASRIAMLNSDGTLNGSFITNILNGQVNDIAEVNKTILIGGTFTTVNGTTANRVAGLDSTGAIDNNWYTSAIGMDLGINKFLTNRAHRRVATGGNFTDAHGHLADFLVGFKSTNVDMLAIYPILCPGAVTSVVYNVTKSFNAGNTFTIELSDSSGNFTSATSVGNKTSSSTGIDSIVVRLPNSLPTGCNYRVRVISTNPVDTSDISGTICISTAPAVTVTASGPTTFCKGDSVVLSAQPGADSYFWNTGATTSSLTVTADGSYTVSATRNNCNAVSTPINVVANPVPDSSVFVASAGICNGGSLSLTAAPNLIYAWSNGSTNQTITVTTSGNYTVTVTNSHNCAADSTVVADITNYFSTLINPSGPTTFCQGGSVTLVSIPNVNYAWSSGATTQSIVVNATGDYSVTVNDGTCYDTSSVLHVTVNALPTVTLSLPVDTVCYNNGVVTLSGGGPSGGTYSGNGVNGTSFDPFSLANNNVGITYTYSDANSCSNAATDTISVKVCTGIDELQANSILVFPNPATDQLFIKASGDQIKDVEIDDLLGEPIMRLNASNSIQQYTVDISTLAAGTYFLKVGEKKSLFVKAMH